MSIIIDDSLQNAGRSASKEVRTAADLAGIKDSGDKEAFATGSVRDKQAGKGAFHLVPTWVVWLVSRVYEGGAIKYEARNWEKGQPLSQYIKSAENHLAKLKMGLRDEPHASQVIWNMFGYIFTAVLIKLGRRPGSLSDMPDQLHCVPGTLAEPLSNVEYESLNTFFQGAETIPIPETAPHLSVEEEEAQNNMKCCGLGEGPCVPVHTEYRNGKIVREVFMKP